jgi:cytochrome c oxidase assembly protein subunit 15
MHEMTDYRPGVFSRAIYVANLVAQCLIIITGVVVRLTASGLGCSTWPQCVPGSYVPTPHQAQAWHKYVEFGNRLLTFVLVIIAIAVIVIAIADAVLARRRGQRVRKDVLLLAFVPILGTVAQAVLGGITVLTGLNPYTVSAHLLVSMAIVAGSVALVVRSRVSPPRPLVVPSLVNSLAWTLVVVSAAVVFVGVIVTGSGPHSGDSTATRLPVDTRTVAWFHADLVLLFLGLLVGLIVALAVVHAPRAALRTAVVLLLIALAQGALGYTQYFLGVPELLVALHVTGATALWVTVLFIPPALRVSAGTDPQPPTRTAAPST